STTTNKPSGAAWNAYAVDGNVVYIVDTSGEGSVLLKWVPGQSPTQVTTLESTGADIGEFWEFGVSGTTMVFVESGRVWKLDLSTNQSKWLGNHTEATGTVDFRPDGALFSTADALEFYNYAQDALIDISAKIDANPYQVNATFATASRYDQDFAR